MRIAFRAGLALLAVVTGCTLASRSRLDDAYGRTDPARYDRVPADAAARAAWEKVVPVVEGFLGTYPNVFHVVDAAGLDDYVDAIAGLRTEADYAALLSRFGIRRTDPRFWAHSDALHAAYRRRAPVEAGLFDYNRYENR